MLYSPVIDDCVEVKWLPFHVMYSSICPVLTTKVL